MYLIPIQCQTSHQSHSNLMLYVPCPSLRKFTTAIPYSTSVVSLRMCKGNPQGLIVDTKVCHGTKVWAGGKWARELNSWINIACCHHYRALHQSPSNLSLISLCHTSSLINLPISHNVALVGRDGEKNESNPPHWYPNALTNPSS